MEKKKDIREQTGKYIGKVLIGNEIIIDMPKACRICPKAKVCDKKIITNEGVKPCYIPCG